MIMFQKSVPSVLLPDSIALSLAHFDDAKCYTGEDISFFTWQEREGGLCPGVSKQLRSSTKQELNSPTKSSAWKQILLQSNLQLRPQPCLTLSWQFGFPG